MFGKSSSHSNVGQAAFPVATPRPRHLAAAAVILACCLAAFSLSGCGGTAGKSSLADYSWSELSRIAAEISQADSDEEGREIAAGYNLLNGSGKTDGKTKSVTLSDGTIAHVMLAGVRQDDLSSGGKAGLTFVFADSPAVHQMNEEASSEGGWEKSKMRSWLNDDFLDMLPGDLKSAVQAASKKTDSSAYTSPGSVSSTSDKIWLPSLVEVGGSVSPNDLVGGASGSGIPAGTYNAEGKQYQVFADAGVSAGEGNALLERTFTGADSQGSGIVVSGESSPWWLRSLSTTWTAGFEAVDAEGDPMNAWMTDYALGVAPGFCL